MCPSAALGSQLRGTHPGREKEDSLGGGREKLVHLAVSEG